VLLDGGAGGGRGTLYHNNNSTTARASTVSFRHYSTAIHPVALLSAAVHPLTILYVGVPTARLEREPLLNLGSQFMAHYRTTSAAQKPVLDTITDAQRMYIQATQIFALSPHLPPPLHVPGLRYHTTITSTPQSTRAIERKKRKKKKSENSDKRSSRILTRYILKALL